MQDNGTEFPKLQAQRLRFVLAQQKMVIRLGDKVLAETDYRLDTVREPATIQTTYEGQPTLGIYRLEGDRLQICLSGSATKLPDQFASHAGSHNRMLIILRRGDIGPVGRPLFVVQADGKGLRPLAELPTDMSTGSPDWSRDGSRIAFDAWRLARGEDYSAAHVYVVNADGTGLKDIGVGAMPSWSPDGTRVTFCQYSPNSGVWIMQADGSKLQRIDAQGWGSDWSPAGDEIAYKTSDDFRNITVYNVRTEQRRKLLEKPRYATIYWNLNWSSDGQEICFQGDRAEGEGEVAVVSARGEAHGFRVVLSTKDTPQYKYIQYNVAWGGAGADILVCMAGPEDRNCQLYRLDPQAKQPPRRVAGQDAERENLDMAWSPDAKRIVFASGER